MEISEIVLSDELRLVGLSKVKLAELLGVSRQTVQRMGESVSDEVLAVIRRDIPQEGERQKEPKDYTDEEVAVLIARRGGMEGDLHREKETDYEISRSVGLRVWEFNALIADWVRRHPYVGRS